MTKKLQAILEAEGLSALLGKFNAQGVTDSILGELTDSDLKELGVDKLGERKRLLSVFASAAEITGSSEANEVKTSADPQNQAPGVAESRSLSNSALPSSPPIEPSRNMVCIPSGICISEESGLTELPVNEFMMSEFRITVSEWREVYDWAMNNDFKFRSAEDFEHELLDTMVPDFRIFDDENELRCARENFKALLADQRKLGKSELDAKQIAYRSVLLDKGCGRGEGVFSSVIKVNWFDVIAWCNAKSLREGLQPVYLWGGENSQPHYKTHYSGQRLHHPIAYDTVTSGYRLPTALEWVYVAANGVPDTGSRSPLDPNLLGVYEMPISKPTYKDCYDDPGGVMDWLWDCSIHHDTIGCDSRQTSSARPSGVHAMNDSIKCSFHTVRNSKPKGESKPKGGLFGFLKTGAGRTLIFH